MAWWRAYDEAVDDPKLQRLTDALFKAWFNLMCIASRHDGVLPCADDIAFSLRIKPARAEAILQILRDRGLLDETADGLIPHNWNGRQFKSDVTDETAAERMRKYRNKNRNERNASRNGDRNHGVTVTVPRAETDTEQITEREDSTADAVSTTIKYEFEDGIIRLSKKDLDKWQKAFVNLDLRAELIGLSAWAGEQGPRWFHAVSGALAKRNRDVGLRKSAAAGGKQLVLTPSGNPWPEGIS